MRDNVSRRAVLQAAPAVALRLGSHEAAIEKAVEQAGGLPIVPRGGLVVLKVNSNSADPAPYSSSPTLVSWVARLYVKQGVRVLVGDRSFWGDKDTAGNLERNGIAPAARSVGARCVAFEHDTVAWNEVPAEALPSWVAPIRVPRAIFEANAVINLACAKTHFITGVTLGLKNALAKAPPRRSRRPFVVAAALLAAALAVGIFVKTRENGLPMELFVDGVGRAASLGTRWLETKPNESATVKIADIGQVTVDPGSRVRLLNTGPAQHRLELTRGTLHARVTAPPRLFVVETPTASAIDLGCAYRLKVTDEGSELTVESGMVSLAGKGREVTVLEGMRAISSASRAPTTPVAIDASPAFIEAVARFDRDGTGVDQLIVLARPADAATLWHLLPVVPPDRRASVFGLLRSMVRAPETVTVENSADATAPGMQKWLASIIASR
jgi:ferric-dicitrate binding protein FerR (iron transport regulator)